jgi:hypothetical protein
MTDHEHDEHGPHGEGCLCHLDPLSGPRVRLDVATPDAETAARIAEALSRQVVGYAVEGMVASLLVVPNALEVEVDTEIGYGQ